MLPVFALCYADLPHVETFRTVSQEQIWQAEESYSIDRLRALAAEWSSDYKTLVELASVFQKFPQKFLLSQILNNEIEDNLLNFLAKYGNQKDAIYSLIENNLYDPINRPQLIFELVQILYKVGIFGIKTSNSSKVFWITQGLQFSELDPESTIYIHPAFWRALRIEVAYL